MKISVITPSYNDAESIKETYLSLKSQTYENWEWIIINDGSTDNTNEILRELSAAEPQDKIIWKEQTNADQLNAIIHGTNYVTGDYVFILHSDDLLPSEDFFEKCLSFLKENPDYNGIFGDLLLIDENNKPLGKQQVKEYRVSKHIPPLQLLWLGRNLFCDVAFHKTEIFKNQILNSYLIWNTPFWLDYSELGIKMLNYKKADFPLLKYRLHSGNYINNDLGKLNVINGELRTAIRLMRFYSIPLYNIQYFLFRLFNKFGIEYKPLYLNRETSDKSRIVKFIIKKRYPSTEDNAFLDSLYSFYRNKTKRTLVLNKLPQDLPLYYGKDVRMFNKKLLAGELEEFYISFLNEMKKGFSSVKAESEDDIQAIKDILKFFCIDHVGCFAEK